MINAEKFTFFKKYSLNSPIGFKKAILYLFKNLADSFWTAHGLLPSCLSLAHSKIKNLHY